MGSLLRCQASGSPDGVLADTKQSRQFGNPAAFTIAQPPDLLFLLRREGRGAPSDPAALAGGCQPFASALCNSFPLELGDRGKDVKHQPACGRGGVDILGQGAKAA